MLIPAELYEHAMAIMFDDAEHRYFYVGEEVPSVTKIISSVLMLKYSPSSFSSDIGTMIHKMLADHDMGLLASVADTYEGFVTTWEAVVEGLGVDFRGVEFPVVHPQAKYAGTVDRLGVQDGKFIVLDIKTGKESDWHPVQVTAYAEAIRYMSDGFIRPEMGAIVYLQPPDATVFSFAVKDYRKRWDEILTAYQKAFADAARPTPQESAPHDSS